MQEIMQRLKISDRLFVDILNGLNESSSPPDVKNAMEFFIAPLASLNITRQELLKCFL